MSNKGFASVNHYDKSAGAVFIKKIDGSTNPDIAAVDSNSALNNDLHSFRSTQNSVEQMRRVQKKASVQRQDEEPSEAKTPIVQQSEEGAGHVIKEYSIENLEKSFSNQNIAAEEKLQVQTLDDMKQHYASSIANHQEEEPARNATGRLFSAGAKETLSVQSMQKNSMKQFNREIFLMNKKQFQLKKSTDTKNSLVVESDKIRPITAKQGFNTHKRLAPLNAGLLQEDAHSSSRYRVKSGVTHQTRQE